MDKKNQFAVQRIIKDIRAEDPRVQITGHAKRIVENEDFIILNDNTGEIRVNTGDHVGYNPKKDDLINVIGTLNLNVNGRMELSAQIIQDMNKLNFQYYQKLYELKRSINK